MVESSSSTSVPYVSMNKDSEVVLFLPAAAAICLLDFNFSIPTAWAPQVLAGIMPARSNLLTHFHVVLLECLIYECAICQGYSFFFAELTQLILQSQSFCSFPTLPFSVTDNLRPFFSTSSFSFFITYFAISSTSLFLPFTKAVMSSTKTLSFKDG